MEDYQQRVLDEKTELDAKIQKLEVFLSTPIFDNMPRTARELLIIQYAYMGNYSTILSQRIVLFDKKEV